MQTIEDFARGFSATPDTLTCGYCDFSLATNQVYPADDRFYLPAAAMARHVATQHGGPAAALLTTDLGLSPAQANVVDLLAQGLSDSVIAARLGITATTVRNHRFKLRSKIAAATRLVALGQLLALPDNLVLPAPAATQLDDRYAITTADRDRTIATFVDATGRIATWPSKEKRKLILLAYLMRDFDATQNYSEPAVNQILQRHVSDYATVRRNLIEYGLLDRTSDGRAYWVKQAEPAR